jgi:hypothetical protein
MLSPVSSATSASTAAVPHMRPPELLEPTSDDADERKPELPQAAPGKHPLSVVDSEELKRKGHGMSLPDDEPRLPPPGARSHAVRVAHTCKRPSSGCFNPPQCAFCCLGLTFYLCRSQACRTATPSLRQTASAASALRNDRAPDDRPRPASRLCGLVREVCSWLRAPPHPVPHLVCMHAVSNGQGGRLCCCSCVGGWALRE